MELDKEKAFCLLLVLLVKVFLFSSLITLPAYSQKATNKLKKHKIETFLLKKISLRENTSLN